MLVDFFIGQKELFVNSRLRSQATVAQKKILQRLDVHQRNTQKPENKVDQPASPQLQILREKSSPHNPISTKFPQEHSAILLWEKIPFCGNLLVQGAAQRGPSSLCFIGSFRVRKRTQVEEIRRQIALRNGSRVSEQWFGGRSEEECWRPGPYKTEEGQHNRYGSPHNKSVIINWCLNSRKT